MQKDPSTKETNDHEETSSKTLHEIEEDEIISVSGNDNASTPSPDGAFDESGAKEQATDMSKE